MAETVRTDFRLLGAVEVVRDGQLVTFRGARPRELLLILLLHRNRTVTAEQITTSLWADNPPRSATTAIQVYVHAIRDRLGGRHGDGGQLLVTRPGGYQLITGPEQVDIDRFVRLVEQANAAYAARRLEDAWERYAAALALWRGPALADVADRPFARSEIARLQQRRLAAVEAQVRVGLELGRHHELIGELEAQVHVHPTHTPLHELLMLALYRSGRQAEALAVYQTTRRLLVDQLGLEPSASLHDLQRAILAHDPSLDVHPAARADLSPALAARQAPPSPPTATSEPPRPREERKGGHRAGRWGRPQG